jgi:signal transduction histidine kinase
LSPDSESRALAEAAGWLWEQWQRDWKGHATSSRRLVHGEVTLLWRSGTAEPVVLALPPSVLGAWTSELAAGEHISLITNEGRVLAGPEPPFGPAAVKLAGSETGLPWTLVLSPADSSRQIQELAGRRRLLFAGLVAIVLLLAGGSYSLWRIVQREFAVARLQSEFVSAVSHEFRTPLTSLRHITDLLAEDDNLPQERRRSFYEALGRNTERLHRLVESLLDFARMEGRRKPYDLQPVDAGELAAQVVADFRKEVEPRGYTVDLEVEASDGLVLRADTASLTNALWNLLDNAVKYSPDGRAVRVSVHRHPSGVAFAVRDQGIGVARHERQEIFRKFVRGERARRLGIKGTGLGLAIVSHIVHAHGGTVELDSEEGAGSTFRLVLPAGS